MEVTKKIIAILAAVIGYGWLWGVEKFTRVQEGNVWFTTHPSFEHDMEAGDYTWPYFTKSEELFYKNFPNEKITGSQSPGRWIISEKK